METFWSGVRLPTITVTRGNAIGSTNP
uniref:Uncharacterized protein n=1 Tax=Anguilla anguilla TaxID=7936 RepID=A0A0E9VR60_ANGAN